jgi:MFS transporter, CP family, cyanate transporter
VGTGEPRRVASAWRALGAWELGAFFGLQSLLYYAVTAWLPSMLRDGAGVDSASAGTALSMLQFWGIAGALAVPVIVRMVPNRYPVVLMLLVLWISLFAGMWLAPSAWVVWSLLGGLAQGGALAVGLSLIVDRSSGAAAARTVSGTVQTVGYCLGATGPVAIGGVIAATGSYTVPWPIFIAISLVWGAVGFRAASSRLIR